MRATEKRTPAGKAPIKKLVIECGLENAIFDISLYGPGGSSRCIRFGENKEHIITPIEFEALAGKKTKNWKFNIRSNGRPLKTLFENEVIKTCEKTCICENCETGKKFPTNLELLIEKVYMRRPEFDLKRVKIEKDDKDVMKAKENSPKKKVADSKLKKELNKKDPVKTDTFASKTEKTIPDIETNCQVTFNLCDR